MNISIEGLYQSPTGIFFFFFLFIDEVVRALICSLPCVLSFFLAPFHLQLLVVAGLCVCLFVCVCACVCEVEEADKTPCAACCAAARWHIGFSLWPS